jgi:hypothetical protein
VTTLLTLIPVGYLLKTVSPKPDWLLSDTVEDIFSASGCISADFADYIKLWSHNGYWLFDSPAQVAAAAARASVETAVMTLFYYEAFRQQYDPFAKRWLEVAPEPSFHTTIVAPEVARLAGFDVVTVSESGLLEHSPLSCNGLAAELSINRHCLFDRFEAAYDSVASGRFDNSEEGFLRILSVSVVDDAWRTVAPA